MYHLGWNLCNCGVFAVPRTVKVICSVLKCKVMRYVSSSYSLWTCCMFTDCDPCSVYTREETLMMHWLTRYTFTH